MLKLNKRTLASLVIFSVMGIILLASSTAAPNGLKAAKNPKESLGVSGTPATVFARWLGRENITTDIKYGETNAHFSPSSIDAKIQAAATNSQQRTLVVTISATPENNTNFMPDPSKNNQLCGTVGTSSDATKNTYNLAAGTHTINNISYPLARSNLKAAKHDENKNDINDNIENLYRATKGCFDNTYTFIADSIIKHKAYEHWPDGRPKMIIRFGHEHDGDFYEWSSTNQTTRNIAAANALTGNKSGNQLYKETWQHAVSLIEERVRSAAPTADVLWEFNMRYKGAQNGSTELLDNTYPGDQYVDVVGIDFYDRVYGNPSTDCFLVVANEQQVPDCRTQAEKEAAWSQTEVMLNTISNFAAEHNKLIGVSEQAVSTAQITIDGKKYWENGGDNAYYVQKSYDWVKDQTTNKKRLAYYVIFERNGANASKELSSDLGADGLKSIHKMTPGANNNYQLPANDTNSTCALTWDYVPLDASGNDVAGAAPQTHLSRFPKAATKFLELWSGPLDGGSATHTNCKKLFSKATPQTKNVSLQGEAASGTATTLSDPAASNNSYLLFKQPEVSLGQFTFAAAGDFSSGINAKKVFEKIGSDSTDFMLALGDLSYTYGNEESWCDLVKERVGSDYPVQLIAGNHDQSATSDIGILKYRQCLPNKMANMTGDYAIEYTFDYKDIARFIMISPDIQFQGASYTKNSEHYNWVKGTVLEAKAKNIPWVILGMHKNCITIGVKECEIGADIMNLALETGVDLILQGHEHGYYRSKQLSLSTSCNALIPNTYNSNCVADEDNSLTKGNGGLIVISGAGGKALRNVNLNDSEINYFKTWNGANTGNSYGYSKFTLNKTILSGSFVSVTGAFSDQFTITKP